jgi:hypothetical protein
VELFCLLFCGAWSHVRCQATTLTPTMNDVVKKHFWNTLDEGNAICFVWIANYLNG